MANSTLATAPAAIPNLDGMLALVGPHLEELRDLVQAFRQQPLTPQATFDFEKKRTRSCVVSAERCWRTNTIALSRPM